MEVIRSIIPLGSGRARDKLVRHYLKKGKYSTKSWYHFFMTQVLSNLGVSRGATSSSNPALDWSITCHCKVLNKISAFFFLALLFIGLVLLHNPFHLISFNEF